MSAQEQQYIRGFNHGYLLTKHLPELVAKLVRRIEATTSDYLSGFFSGKEEYELEVSRTQLDELDQLRNKTKDRGHDLEHDM